MEKALEYERKIHDRASRAHMPSHAQWLEVQYLKVHAYEHIIDYIDNYRCDHRQVDALTRVGNRIRSVENTLGPAADHFTERLTS